jgi:hypothetical protein
MNGTALIKLRWLVRFQLAMSVAVSVDVVMVVFPSGRLSDQAQVIDTLNRMAWYEDRHRWTELEDLLADDIQVGYGEHHELELVTLSRGDLIANWRSGLEHNSSQHIVSGITLDGIGDTAHATLNEKGWTQGKTADGLSLYQFGTAMECTL